MDDFFDKMNQHYRSPRQAACEHVWTFYSNATAKAIEGDDVIKLGCWRCMKCDDFKIGPPRES